MITIEKWCENICFAAERVKRSGVGKYDDPGECKEFMFTDVAVARFLQMYDEFLHHEVRHALTEFVRFYDTYPVVWGEPHFRTKEPRWMDVMQAADVFLRAVRKHGWFKPGSIPDP